MRTLAILPVKRFELAKTRLGEQLQPRERRTLAQAMVSDVLDALLASEWLEAVVVVTNETTVSELAHARGARVLTDAAEAGQSAAALIGVAHALAEGYERVLLVPGDCPALNTAALRTLLERPMRAPAVTIVSDRAGSGTNALLLVPPDAIEPGFGPDSFARHRDRTEQARADWHSEPLPQLLLDIDTPEDLALLRSAHAGPATAVVLAEL
ncbi:MAG TPA: 2-phospho-L-lactate guanylyltransferase [Solirubrobacteraceae bacterium]|jgi:2-phospho-L-lactate guanylyltransferase